MCQHEHDRENQEERVHPHCCPCGGDASTGSGEFTRRSFLGGMGGAALGGMALAGLSWSALSAAEPEIGTAPPPAAAGR